MIRSEKPERDTGYFFIRCPVIQHHNIGEVNTIEMALSKRKMRVWGHWKIFETSWRLSW
jgi:hypothetical protein